MSKKSRSPAWPFLSILACLFVLSITAPRAWQRIAHTELLSPGKHPPSPRHEEMEDRSVVSGGNFAASPAAGSRDDRLAMSKPAEATPPIVSTPAPVPAIVESAPAAQAAEMPAPVASPMPVANSAPAPSPIPVAVAPAFGNQVVADPLLMAAKLLPEKFDADEVLVPPPAPQSVDPETAVSLDQNWTMPAVLLDQLAALTKVAPCHDWALSVGDRIRALSETPPPGEKDLRIESLDALAALVASGQQLAGKLEDPAEQTRLSRTHYALERRLGLWRQIISPDEIVSDQASAAANEALSQRVSSKVKEIETLIASSDARDGWREYLQLDRLGKLAGSENSDTAERRELARLILDRLARAQASREQRQFVAGGPLAALGEELHGWSAEPISPQRLLSRLEAYERTGLSSDAELLAADCHWLRWSDQPGDRQLASEVDGYYRNANLRVAIAGTLVNRFLPKPTAVNTPISDTLIGVPVRGRSTTWTQLYLRLVPDPRRIRLGLEATGVVASDTSSSSGPATFYNNGTSTFLARKLYVIGPKGLRDWPAIAEARSGSNNLVSLETEFDGIPLFGSLVRSIARSQFEDSQPEALGEAQQKLANRARAQFDNTVNQRMREAHENFQKQFLRRVERLGVEITPVSFNTSEERLVARLRIADNDQLGAHTPRPRALSDSLISLQLHQSAANNLLDHLELAGRKFAIADLFQWINRKLDRPQPPLPDDLPDDVFITFAKKDPVLVRFANDRAELCLNLAELTQGRNRWRNFSVRASYRPETQELQAGLQRDSGIRLEGESLKGKPVVLLRGIFSRVLSSNRQIQLIADKFAKDDRVKDLAISQFVIDDGWLGLACGPKRADLNARRISELESNRGAEVSKNH